MEANSWRSLADKRFAFDDQGYASYSGTEQKRVEDLVNYQHEKYLHSGLEEVEEGGESRQTHSIGPILHRQQHIEYILSRLRNLSRNSMVMDASRSWYCFWGLHALRILGYDWEDAGLINGVIEFLKSCQSPSGGYGGAPGQLPHLATSYASVMALVSIGTTAALESINRPALYSFIDSLRQANGSFRMHDDGEVDIRGAFCAVAAATICNIVDEKLFENTAHWIARCQTYEGGFGGEPDCEAHGGYTCCGVTSLTLLRKSHLLDVQSALRWLVNRQMRFEGGFQGRTNKLVDGCYSFWLSAAFFTLECELSTTPGGLATRGLFDEVALQNYVLVICQDTKGGGLRDKPDRSPDMYHTCYALAGLSIAQSHAKSNGVPLVGGESSRLAEVHPLYNVCADAEAFARRFFELKR